MSFGPGIDADARSALPAVVVVHLQHEEEAAAAAEEAAAEKEEEECVRERKNGHRSSRW